MLRKVIACCAAAVLVAVAVERTVNTKKGKAFLGAITPLINETYEDWYERMGTLKTKFLT